MKNVLLLLFIATTRLCINAQTPNWAEHVAPVLYNNCTSCHISGGIAPFSLVGYDNAKNAAAGIKSAATAKRMPPWKADPNYKRFAHERLLSAEEIKTLADWVDNATPQGDLSKAPADPTPINGTTIANPDLNLRIPDYLVKTTSDLYRCFVLPAGTTKDQFLTQLEIVPGNRKIVHHVLVFWDTTQTPQQLDQNDPGPGYTAFGGTGSNSSTLIGLWAPGGGPFNLPAGMGISIPKNASIILQIHYPSNINNEYDSTRVYAKLSSASLRPILISPVLNHGSTLTNGPLVIPANQTKTFYAAQSIPANATVIAVAPHMHLLGQNMTVFETLGTDTNPLIKIPQWDFHWQGAYFFRNPIKVRSNSTLKCQALYDNTSSNPYNPNTPPKIVTVGEGTTQEMLLVYFWYTYYLPGDENIVIDNSPLKDLTLNNKNSLGSSLKPRVYPNPSSDLLLIEGTNIEEAILYTTNGKNLMNIQGRNSSSLQLDLRNLSGGLYCLAVKQDNSWWFERISKI